MDSPSSSNTQYDINNMIGFTIVGILIKLFFGTKTEDGSSGPASASIWGYGVVTLAILSILVIFLSLASKISILKTYSVFGFLEALIKYTLPSVFTLIILIWLITINVIYFKRINQGKVANEYYTYSAITTFIVIFQIITLFKFLTDNVSKINKDTVGSVPTSTMAYVTYFLSFLNVIFIGIMTVILKFFSTDG